MVYTVYETLLHDDRGEVHLETFNICFPESEDNLL